MAILNFIASAYASIGTAKVNISRQVILSDGTVVEDPSDVHLYNKARDYKNKLLAEREQLLEELNKVHPTDRGRVQAEINRIDELLNPQGNATESSTSTAIATNLQNHLDELIEYDSPKNDYDTDELVNRIDVEQFSSIPISENNPLDDFDLGDVNSASLNWLPPHIQEIVALNPELEAQLKFLSVAATMPLDDFQSEVWPNAAAYPQFDWVNDGCSVPDWLGGPGVIAEGMEVPCIRHDFSYRNFERIDAQFGFNGILLEHHGAIENIADDQLGADADSVSDYRSRVVETGVELPGSGADSVWEEPDDWNDPDRNFYGEGYTPEDFNN